MKLKFLVPPGDRIGVETMAGKFTIQIVPCKKTWASEVNTWSIVAVSECEKGSFDLSLERPTQATAEKDWSEGFEITDPRKEPAHTYSRVVLALIEKEKAELIA